MIYVMNVDTLAVSRYDLAVRDVTTYNKETYLLTSLLLRKFDSSSAEAVQGVVKTGRLSPLLGHEYNIPYATLTLKGVGDATVTSRTERLGLEDVEDWTVTGRGYQDQFEIPLSVGWECRSYQFQIELARGVSLSSFEGYIDPVRVRKA